jgi:hypothetical protein
LAARPDMENHEWIAPAFPWLDESKEIQAQAKKMELGVVSHSEICKTLQHERADVVDQRESEVVDAIERAQRVKETTGVLPPWQMFAGLPLQNAHLFEESPPPAQGDEAVDAAPEQPVLEESDDVES